jgi:hypothetical protein
MMGGTIAYMHNEQRADRTLMIGIIDRSTTRQDSIRNSQLNAVTKDFGTRVDKLETDLEKAGNKVDSLSRFAVQLMLAHANEKQKNIALTDSYNVLLAKHKELELANGELKTQIQHLQDQQNINAKQMDERYDKALEKCQELDLTLKKIKEDAISIKKANAALEHIKSGDKKRKEAENILFALDGRKKYQLFLEAIEEYNIASDLNVNLSELIKIKKSTIEVIIADPKYNKFKDQAQRAES